MSWSATTPQPIDKKHIETIVGQPQTSPDDVGASYRDHLAAAIEAASILASAVGRDDDQITVNLSGHANPDHAPCRGWADEFIQISVSARPLPDNEPGES